jgi:phage/plasmid-like protein (TIGR03299 family)
MHAITERSNGKAEMAYVGETPWHGLGQRLTPDAGLDVWLQAAGMDWRIQRSRIRYVSDEGTHILEDDHVLFRSDTKQPLGIVSKGYKVVQPREVLEFFADLLPVGYKLETAGTLHGGKKFWALASIGEDAIVIGKDQMRGYLLLVSSADGSVRTTAKPTAVRVVCQNTLSLSWGDYRTSIVAVSHRSKFDANAVKDKLGLARGHFHAFMKQTRLLAAKPVTKDVASDFIGGLLTETGLVSKKDVAQSRPFREMFRLFDGDGRGSTLEGVDGTLWGLVNSVTEYVDHHARAASQNNRLDSAWFGRGDDIKTKAMIRALELV